MNDNALLIVVGDHGMTSDGNHGGNSTDESNTVIWAYRKNGFNSKRSKIYELLKFDDTFEQSVP